MLLVLALIDVVMISNLLVMVIVGGYETFVSRLRLQGHPDQPEWLDHVNASVLKIKLAMAIIGISSIHLLKTFIEAGSIGTRAREAHRGRRDVADHHPHHLHPVGRRHRLGRPIGAPLRNSETAQSRRQGALASAGSRPLEVPSSLARDIIVCRRARRLLSRRRTEMRRSTNAARAHHAAEGQESPNFARRSRRAFMTPWSRRSMCRRTISFRSSPKGRRRPRSSMPRAILASPIRTTWS